MEKTIEKNDISARYQKFIKTATESAAKCLELAKDPAKAQVAIVEFLKTTQASADRFLSGMPATFREASIKEVLTTTFGRIPAQVLVKTGAAVLAVVKAVFAGMYNVIVAIENIFARAINWCAGKEVIPYWHFYGMVPEVIDVESTAVEATEQPGKLIVGT